MTDLAELTTLRVGGPIGRLVEADTADRVVAAVREAEASGGDWLLLGGGSNTVASDAGFEGTVVRVASRGVERLPDPAEGTVRLRVQAGEDWDALVELAVRSGWSGLETLSGIPGCVGAAPVQNIGAYGRELASVLVAVDLYDPESEVRERVPAADLGLGYRTSALKRGDRRGVVLALELDLCAEESLGAPLAAPIAYAQLADTLGVPLGARVSLAEARRTVLALRASKGMLLDPDDPDAASAGSFFTNPIVRESFARELPAAAPRFPLEPEAPDVVVALDGADGPDPLGRLAEETRARAAAEPRGPRLVKLSAAWLIEHAGVRRGYGLPGSRAAISDKHTLAITNRGGASAAEVMQLAEFVRSRVQAEFGVNLQPEPVLVGLTL